MRLARFLLTFFKPLFWLLFPYKVIGRENVPPEGDPTPLMLCPNHISDIDPVFVLMAMKRHVYYMAKAELFRNKLAAWFVGMKFGAFPVKRGAGDTGAIDTAKQIVESGKVLGIFPEGTRSKDGKLGRAKSGAALWLPKPAPALCRWPSKPRARRCGFSGSPPWCSAIRFPRRSCILTILSIRTSGTPRGI